MSAHRMRRWLPLLGVVLFAVALAVIVGEVRSFGLEGLRAAWRAIPGWRIAAALGLTATSYSVLTCYDVLALRYIGRPLSYARTALASFAGFSFNMNIGVSVVGGAAVRYRLYTGWGLTAAEVAKVVAFCALTVGVGLVGLGGLVFLLGDVPPGAEKWLPAAWLRPIGAALVAAVAVYVAACAWFDRPLRLWGVVLELPRPRMALTQVALSAVDFVIAGTVLYTLYAGNGVGYVTFLGVYLFSLTAGLVSHVPGGLGVFETAFMLCLPPSEQGGDRSVVLATVLAFRAVYYALPFAIAAALFGMHEWQARRAAAAQAG
jgi:uncharacterized membrane protein YbhN (UPF0104 family)